MTIRELIGEREAKASIHYANYEKKATKPQMKDCEPNSYLLLRDVVRPFSEYEMVRQATERLESQECEKSHADDWVVQFWLDVIVPLPSLQPD